MVKKNETSLEYKPCEGRSLAFVHSHVSNHLNNAWQACGRAQELLVERISKYMADLQIMLLSKKANYRKPVL